MNLLRVSPASIAEIYGMLDAIGCLGDPRKDGFLRSSWSQEEDEAIDLIRQRGEQLGLTSRFDAIGNFVLEIPGSSPQFVETGSHVDTVVQGGNFDGAGGVVAGLLAIEAILKSGVRLTKGLRLRVWRGEEGSTYAVFCKGSQAAFGLLPKGALDRQFRGKTLRDAIRERGFDPTPIEAGRAVISQDEIDAIAAHIELHIEQANSLEERKLDIGVITSIRAPIRWRISLEGSFDHSGGTPMGSKFRRDVNLAICKIGVALNELAERALAEGNDLVQTIGVINSDFDVNSSDQRIYQNATAKVSGFGYFHLDIRSAETAFRKKYVADALATVERVAEELRVKPTFELISSGEPLEVLPRGIQDAVQAAAQGLGLRSTLMPSGAVHDCLHLGQQKQSSGSEVPVGMIFVPCREGKSHCPEEFTSLEELANGASVLATAMLALAS